MEENFALVHSKASSNIKQLEYDSARSVLRVTFNGDRARCYDYYGVPPTLVFEMLMAESVGRFFNANLRQRENLFPYREVGKEA